MNEYTLYQEGLIKSLLAQPEQLTDIVEYIDANDFSDVNYQMVYKSILDLHMEKRPIALPEISLKISENGGAIDPVWLFNLETNISKWVQQAPPTTWAKLLKRESVKSKAKMVMQEGAKEIEDRENDPLTIIDQISTGLTDVSTEATSIGQFSIEEALDEFLEESEEIRETGGKLHSIHSSYPTIDYYTGGWGATQLITVGARTGVGKSVFAINNLVAALQQDKTVLFFSLEMSRREVLSRVIASMATIPIQTIEKALPLTQEEQERYDKAIEALRGSKLKLDTNPEVTVDYIKRQSIKQAQSEDGLDMIIIDYLQLIDIGNRRNRSRQEGVAEVSRNMKILAKELNVPVMVLAQLNREKREDEDPTPRISDIRDSGAIANDSNIIILIDRRMDEDENEAVDPKATFIIGKNRQGQSDVYITVRTRLECSLFIDDSEKGQRYLRELEYAVEHGGELTEVPVPEQAGSMDTFGDLPDLTNPEAFSSDASGYDAGGFEDMSDEDFASMLEDSEDPFGMGDMDFDGGFIDDGFGDDF